MSSPLSLRESAVRRRRFREMLGAWFQKSGRDLPWRRTEDPYAILVSELMLQQTQVVTVVPYFRRWLERFPSVAALAAAEEAEVLSVWQGLGYYARARNLHRAARAVVSVHGGRMPKGVSELEALPGVGRYTAGAIASFAYDQAAPAVDANIGRVLARLFDVQTPIDEPRGQAELWAAAELLLPKKGGRLHNSALMELGALVCVPRRPECGACPVRGFCAAKEPGELPRKRPPRATVYLEENCAWIRKGGLILLEQQEGNRLGGLWKLPRCEEPAPAGEPDWEIVYPFTHHRVTLRVHAERPRSLRAREAWVEGARLAEFAMPSPHRRAATALWAQGGG
jgi:A/G-specific adenine glycosylase